MQHLEAKQLKPLLRRNHSYIGRLLVLLQVDKITDDVIKTVAHTGSVQTCQIRSQKTQEHFIEIFALYLSLLFCPKL